MNRAHALGSRVLSCSSTDFKFKTIQPLGSDEMEDWRPNSVWYQALLFLFLIRLSLFLSTSFLQIFAEHPTNESFAVLDITRSLCSDIQSFYLLEGLCKLAALQTWCIPLLCDLAHLLHCCCGSNNE